MINFSYSNQSVSAISRMKKTLALGILLALPAPVFAGPLYVACVAACELACGGVTVATPGPWSIPELTYCMSLCPGMCIWSCFNKDTTIQVLENGVIIEKNIADVHIGDMVATLHDGSFAWTKVVRNIKKTGDFDFVQITASNEVTGNHKRLSVTPTHGMVLLGNDNQSALDTANHVIIGDKIIAANGDVLSVTDIKHDVMHERYTLETVEGTVIASGIFVSTLCAEELEGGKKPFNTTIQDWQKRHMFDDKNERIME